jgi:indole-3-glycerol phosphate synthase
MVRRKEDGEIWIGASGINTQEQVRELKAAGLDALLIGTALMQHGDPGRGLAALTGGQP